MYGGFHIILTVLEVLSVGGGVLLAESSSHVEVRLRGVSLKAVVCRGNCEASGRVMSSVLSAVVEARLCRRGGNPGHGVVREGQGRGNHHGNQGKPVHHSQDVSAGG